MSDNDQTPATQPGDEAAGQEEGRPHRVIGTPPPALSRTLLGPGAARGAPRAAIEPADPAKARRAERTVAGLFLLSMVAGIGFIAAYIGLPVHSLTKVLNSNLALGASMSVVFLALAVGAVIWVRVLMPNVELAEDRKPLASSPEDRKAFEQTFKEGTEQSG